jgi:hypothetical protein
METEKSFVINVVARICSVNVAAASLEPQEDPQVYG